MVLTRWYIRSKSDNLDPTKVYGGSPNFFSLKIHHGGVFTKFPGRSYVDGKVSFVDLIDGDAFSVHELNAMMQEIGYVEQVPMWYHFKTPDSDLDFGLRALGNDDDVRLLLKYVPKFKLLEVYTEQWHTSLKTYLKPTETSKVVIEEIEDDDVQPHQSVQKIVSKKLPCKRGLFITQGNENISKGNENVSDNPFHDTFFTELYENDFGLGGGENVFEQQVLQTENQLGQGSRPNVEELEVPQSQYEHRQDSRPDMEELEVPHSEYEHGQSSRPNVEEEDEDNGNSDSDEDSDFIVDEENIIDDVEVDMRNFRNNIDEDVEWIGCKENPEKVSEENLDRLEEETLNLDEFDSGTDSETDPIRKEALKRLRREHNTNPSKKAHFYVGQIFGSKAEIKELVTLHSVETRRHLHICKNDKRRYRVICKGITPIFSGSNAENVSNAPPTSPSQNVDGPNPSIGPSQTVDGPSCLKPVSSPSGIKWVKKKASGQGTEESGNGKKESEKVTKVGGKESKLDGPNHISCPWVLHISKVVDQDTWMVKTLIDNHKCLQSRDLRKCTASFLSKDIEEQVVPNQNLQADVIRDQLQKKYELGVSKHKIYRANQKAKGKVMGDYTEQYRLLRDYILELQARNPETTVKLDFEREPNPNSETIQFKRIYVCLGALKKGFKACGRDLLGLDGCFMKGVYPGQILTAVGVDPNNQIYPVAYGIVEAESKSSWTWFLKCLGDDLELNHMSNFTFISDRQKGIIPAIQDVFPVAEHRFCLKHIYDNMKGSWKGQLYKDFLWKLATSTTIEKFNKTMEDLKKVSKEAYEWLKEIPARHWSRSHFSGRAHCDVLLNNMCEVFNRQLVDGREKPIILALEYIREYLMKRIVIVQKSMVKCDGPLTPNATVMFNSIKTEAAKYKATWNGGSQFQVVGPWMDQCVVDMSTRVCTCRKWELTGMPCKHALATIWDMAVNGMEVGIPESYVHPVYWLQTWKAMYQFKIGPTTGRSSWPKSDCPISICPPKHHVQIGRPKKKRRKSAVELEIVKQGKLSRQAASVKCGRCKQNGHNKRTCTKVISKSTSAKASNSKASTAQASTAKASTAKASSAKASKARTGKGRKAKKPRVE